MIKELENTIKNIEGEVVSVTRLLQELGLENKNLKKIEDEFIKLAELKYGKIDDTVVIDLEKIIDKSLVPEVKHNYLFSIRFIEKELKEIAQIIHNNK